jgi:hypothetical protein
MLPDRIGPEVDRPLECPSSRIMRLQGLLATAQRQRDEAIVEMERLRCQVRLLEGELEILQRPWRWWWWWW